MVRANWWATLFSIWNSFSRTSGSHALLEEAIIRTCDYGVKAERIEGLTGVWVDADKGLGVKIAALGVKCSRWVTARLRV